MLTRELFDAALDAVNRLEALETARTDLACGRHGGGAAPERPQGVHSDPTANAAIAIAERLDAIADEARSCAALVDEAAQVAAGISAILGSMFADPVVAHYIEGRSWSSLSLERGVSVSTLKRRRRIAFEWVDAVGIAAAKDAGRIER